jgi:hypothetical protein
MNAARRQIISELRHQGLTGKEAYEATKDPSFMKDWVRVVIHDQREDGKPKRPPNPKKHSWKSRLRLLKQQRAIMEMKAIKRAAKSPSVIRGRMLNRMQKAGISMKKALNILRRNYDER